MNKKLLWKVMAIATGAVLSLGMIAQVGVVESHANGLTQVTDASKVKYRKATDEEITMLRGIFNLEYYKKMNPQLAETLGSDPEAWFRHFYTYGIFEGRSFNPDFDPSAYASAYADAKDASKGDIIKCCAHYVDIGKKENRNLTTVKACADNGITVKSLIDDSLQITPDVFKIAQQLGTNDLQAAVKLEKAVEQAAATGANAVVVTTNTSTNEISATPANVVSDDSAASGGSSASDDSAASGGSSASGDPASGGAGEDASGSDDGGAVDPAEPGDDGGEDETPVGLPDGYVKVATISVGGGINIMVYKANGYAAYNYIYSEADSSEKFVLIDKTDNYEGSGESRDTMGESVAYIPVYASTTEYIDGLNPSVPDNSIIFDKEENDNITIQRDSSGTVVTHIIHDYVGSQYNEETGDYEPIEVDKSISATADENATESTTYDIGFSFGNKDDGHVEFEIAVAGDDGFTLNDSYNVQVGTDDSVEDVDGE